MEKNPEFNRDVQVLVQSYLEGLAELIEYVEEKLINGHIKSINSLAKISGVGDDTDKQLAVKVCFYRIHALAHSLSRLEKYIDFNAVANICRTMFEIWLDIEYLYFLDDDDIAIEKFHNYSVVKQYSVAEKIRDYERDNPGVKKYTRLNPDLRKEFLKNNEGKVGELLTEVWGQNGIPRHWTGMKIEKRIKDVQTKDVDFEKRTKYEYFETYQQLNSFVHSGPTGFNVSDPNYFKAVYGQFIAVSRDKYVYSILRTSDTYGSVSYTHLRAHETKANLVCRLLLEKKKTKN